MIISNDPLVKFLLPFPTTLSPVSLEVLVPNGGNASTRRHNSNSTALEFKNATHSFWAPYDSKQAKKEVLAGMHNPDY